MASPHQLLAKLFGFCDFKLGMEGIPFDEAQNSNAEDPLAFRLQHV
jgi:hypothetical protein